MDIKKKVPSNTITRDIKNLAEPTGNIYESVVLLYKRANQIALAEKKELAKKLEDFRTDYPGQLSGGMAQRVALVRSLINEPPVLLLDEPLGALDAFTRMNMQDEILRIWQKKQQLAIMVTHDVDEAIYMGTRVIVMEANPGRIKADIPLTMDYPRNRSSSQFVAYRNQILEMLNYGAKE